MILLACKAEQGLDVSPKQLGCQRGSWWHDWRHLLCWLSCQAMRDALLDAVIYVIWGPLTTAFRLRHRVASQSVHPVNGICCYDCRPRHRDGAKA
jgi:hypothetical protein